MFVYILTVLYFTSGDMYWYTMVTMNIFSSRKLVNTETSLMELRGILSLVVSAVQTNFVFFVLNKFILL